MKNIIVLYHKNCPDGFGAAWSAWKSLKNKAQYIPVDHRDDVPSGLKNKKIFLVDFCYPAEQMEKLLKDNNEVIVIDHHISQAKEVKISTEYVYDNSHSGSVLTWKYFHPKEKIPRLLKYVEDVDIWSLKISKSREVMSAVELYNFTFKVWNKLASDFEDTAKRKKYLEAGEIISKYKKRLAERAMSKGEKVRLGKHEAFAVNSSVLMSEIGNMINEKKKVVGIIWHNKKGKIKASMRSGDIADVSKIAKRFGGGGHKGAAAFSFDAEIKFPWKKIKK